VHTFAKARLTSTAIWQISMNECPLTSFRISEYWRIRKQSLYPHPDPNRHQNWIICSLALCQSSLKISCKSVGKFLRTDKQTNKQTTTKT